MLQVNHYRPHWWRCNGPCVKLPPSFGIVRRAIDRDPSPTDKWWSIHQRQCNGKFTKIKGPGCSRETTNKCENIHRGEKDVKKIDIDTNNNTNVVKDIKPDTKSFRKAEKKVIKSSQIDNNEQLETDKFSNAKMANLMKIEVSKKFLYHLLKTVLVIFTDLKLQEGKLRCHIQVYSQVVGGQ